MVQVRLISGIGNNLYQIATLYHYAKNNCNGKYSVIYPKHDGTIQEIRPNGGHYTKKIDNVPFYIEDVFPNVNWVDSADVDEGVIGSYIFDISSFWDSISEIKTLLKPSDKLTNYIDTKYQHLFTKKTLGIHLRYTNGSDSFIAQENIYEWILDIINKNQDCENIIIVSNFQRRANEFINQQLIPNFKDKNILLIDDESNFVDLFLLSKCDVIICSNSTFSFWSGALSNASKIYISPEYNPANIRNSIPSEWETNSNVFYKYYKF